MDEKITIMTKDTLTQSEFNDMLAIGLNEAERGTGTETEAEEVFKKISDEIK